MARELCEEDKSSDMVAASAGFYYSDNSTIQSHFTNQIQAGFGSAPADMFNLTTGMENMMGFSKNLHQREAGSSLKVGGNESTTDFYQQELSKSAEFTTDSDNNHQNIMVGPWGTQENRFQLVDDSSLRCVFPCEGNERPSQGLSLSLCSSNPSSIGLQSFELRQQQANHNHHHHQIVQQQQQDGFLQGKAAAMFQLRNSRFLAPAQELLYEFCSLGITNNNRQQPDSSSSPKPKGSSSRTKQWELEDNINGATGSSRKLSLQSLDFMELQKRKTKLFSMLEELERRYRHYCDQMKAVVSSFEAVAGSGAATVYTALASKAMSRHFRCLKDGIVSQIQATRKAMGEKDPVAPGTTRGETPRLRAIDQALRQQRAFHQISMMESHPWRPQRGLPERSVSVLRAWLFEHFLHPYPSDVDKHILARQTGLSRSQVSNWFINARVRLWKPMVEEMYLEETKEPDGENHHNFNNNGSNSSDGVADLDHDVDGRVNQSHRSIQTRLEDQKPTPDQLLRIDSECLSSIISNSEKNEPRTTKAMQNQQHHLHNHSFGRVAAETFGTVELDFSSYNHHTGSGGVSYPNHAANNNNQHFNNGGGGVSLTLGLQQHAGGNGGGGVSIAFSPASQSSLFFSRDHMEECQPVQYSLVDGETQNLPYRNLMGAQLLHDLAG